LLLIYYLPRKNAENRSSGGDFEKQPYPSPSLPLPSTCVCKKGQETTKTTWPFRGFAGKCQVGSAERHGDVAHEKWGSDTPLYGWAG